MVKIISKSIIEYKINYFISKSNKNISMNYQKVKL